MTDPIERFRRIAARHARCAWLDGGGATGGRSTLAWLEDDDVSLSYDATTRTVTRHRSGIAETVGDDPFLALQQEMQSADEQWYGYFGYAARPDLPARADGYMPDAVWMRPSRFENFEHVSGTASAFGAAAPVARAPVAQAPIEYRAAFAEVQEQLHAGNSYEVNLTYRERIRSSLPPAEAYLRLRALNPAPYAGYVQHDVPGARAHLLSSSPERYARITADRVLETKPIKGTTSRGATPEEDAQAAYRLQNDAKFRSENLMIVDLLRNDLSAVCDVGTVAVPELFAVESYPSVHQLVTTVRGRLRDGTGAVEALRSLFPAGSMTGAPKLRTMQIIDAVESSSRGAYSGAFGWISGDGRADLGVVIRSLMTAGDGEYRLGTGGGITVLSDETEEYAEARWKAERLVKALDTEAGDGSAAPGVPSAADTGGDATAVPGMRETEAHGEDR